MKCNFHYCGYVNQLAEMPRTEKNRNVNMAQGIGYSEDDYFDGGEHLDQNFEEFNLIDNEIPNVANLMANEHAINIQNVSCPIFKEENLGNIIDVGDDKLVTLVGDKIVFNVVWPTIVT